jgi:hypothetical protein
VIGVRLEVVVGWVVVVVVVVVDSAVGVVCEELLGLSRYSSSLLHRQNLIRLTLWEVWLVAQDYWW